MLLTFILFWVFSTSSHGAPHQPPVDHSRIISISSSAVSQNNVSNPRLQILRGPGQTKIENSPPDSNYRPNYPEYGYQHPTPLGYDPYHLSNDHHNDHDGPKTPKLNKLNIQDFITQRDIEKHRRKDATWKTYFPEILAATILISSILLFLCWWNWAKRGRRPRSGHSTGTGTARDKRRIQRQHTFQRGQSMPELYMNLNQMNQVVRNEVSSPNSNPQQYLKSSFESFPEDPMNGNAKTRWNIKEKFQSEISTPTNV